MSYFEKIEQFRAGLAKARTVAELEEIRTHVRGIARRSCGTASTGKCRKSRINQIKTEIVLRAGEITAENASTIQKNLDALKKDTTPRPAAAPDTSSNAWIAILAGVALLIFLT